MAVADDTVTVEGLRQGIVRAIPGLGYAASGICHRALPGRIRR